MDSASFRAAITASGIEKSAYYAVQRDLLAAAEEAPFAIQIIFFRVAAAAEAMGRYLEDDAINADYLVLWRRYAFELARMIDLIAVDALLDDLQPELERFEAVIYPLRGEP